MPAMSRISAIASDRIQQEKKLLIPYLVAGDPDLPTTLTLMKELVQQGADIIELGIPFSDPASDGPVIQRGVERALNGGTTLRDTLALVAQFREGDTETGIVLMGYLNPIEIMGYENFAAALLLPEWTESWWWICRRRNPRSCIAGSLTLTSIRSILLRRRRRLIAQKTSLRPARATYITFTQGGHWRRDY